MSLETAFSRAAHFQELSHNLEEMDKNDLEAVLKMGKDGANRARLNIDIFVSR